MDQKPKKWLCFLIGFFCLHTLSAQPNYHTLAQDTIVTFRQFPRNQYLLNGKKLNLPVMQWFMSDFPDANDQVQLAMLTNQLSLSGYSVGSLFFLTGLFIWEDNRTLSDELLKLGGVGFAGGIVFQIISQSLEKKAVRFYNNDIKLFYRQGKATSFGVGLGGDMVVVRLSF